MVRSRLLDRGAEEVHFYPEVTVINKRGTPIRTSSTLPITERLTVTADRQALSELNGQVESKVVRLVGRLKKHNIGPWSKVIFRGEEWDISSPPHLSTGASRAIEHHQIILRSRNSLGAERTEDPGRVNV